jgi:hypothetical protein
LFKSNFPVSFVYFSSRLIAPKAFSIFFKASETGAPFLTRAIFWSIAVEASEKELSACVTTCDFLILHPLNIGETNLVIVS